MKKKEKILKLIAKKEKEYESIFTFNPTINDSNSKSVENNSKSRTPRYIKLNNDHKLRQERQRLRTINYYKEKLVRSDKEKENRNLNRNCELASRSKSSSSTNFSLSLLRTGTPNYCDKLYDDAKKIKNRKIELSNDVYKKYSFKPKINENTSIVINSTFDERNNKLIQLKNEFLEKMNKMEEIEKQNKKVFSKEEIEINNKNVVERLYLREIIKINERTKLKQIKNNSILNVNSSSNSNTTSNKYVNTSLRKLSYNSSQDFILSKLRKEHNIKFKNEETEKISEESYTDRINIKDKDRNNNTVQIIVTNSNEGFSTIMNNSKKVSIQLENNYSNDDQIVNYKGIINSNPNSATPKVNPNMNNSDCSSNFRSRALLNIIKVRKENTNK